MARCEDFPCCGHELGCCPDFDEAGRQMNMKCTCGAEVPLSSRSSLCQGCLNAPDEDDPYGRYDERGDADCDEDDDEDEEFEYEHDGQPDWQQEWTDFNGGFEC